MSEETPAVREALPVYAAEAPETERVSPGYRQTEVGVIPEDWEIVPIGMIAKFTSGALIKTTALHRQSSEFPVPVFGGNGIAGYTRNAVTRDPTVVVGRVGQKCGSVYRTDGPAWITDNALYPKQIYRRVELDFLALALEGARLNEVRNRNDLPLITQSIVHAVQIALPPDTSEQRAIAAALSDVDALIAALGKLIAKKRAVKNAAMQQLLTGKQRLPGFRGEWEVKRLGDFAEINSGGTPSSNVPDYYDGSIPWVSISDMTKRGKYIVATDRNLTEKGFANSAARIFPKGTVLYAMYASIGECSIASVDLCSSPLFHARLEEGSSSRYGTARYTGKP